MIISLDRWFEVLMPPEVDRSRCADSSIMRTIQHREGIEVPGIRYQCSINTWIARNTERVADPDSGY